MVNYWDASAIVSLLVGESTAARYRPYRTEQFVTWWGTSIECVSAIARREREGGTASEIITEAYRRLSAMQSEWFVVHANEALRRSAIRFLKAHPLRAGDALHLAAAVNASHFEPTSVRFLTEDARLKQAAAREGFVVDD